MEKTLLQRVMEGDQTAFEELYEEYGEYALRVAKAITRSDAMAADVVQETFIRVYYNIGGFNLKKPFKPWFYRILINECNRILKHKNRVSYISNYIESGIDISVEDRKKFEEYEVLYKAVESLAPIHRIPIILKYLKGFKEAEIAEILGININTLKSRLFKGRRKLRKQMEVFEGRWENGKSV